MTLGSTIVDVINQPRQPHRSGTPSRPGSVTPVATRPPERVQTPAVEAPQPITPAPSSHPRFTTKTWRRFRVTRKVGIVSVIIGALLVSGIVIALIGSAKSTTTKNTAVTPPYPTVLPSGKSIDQLGGWQRISPADSDPVYAYADTISGVLVGVSEQPLPASFTGDTDAQVADLAKKFNATDQQTAGDTKLYIGTSFQGPQSVIFTKKNLLILMKSKSKINDSAWSSYAESLR